MPQTATRRPKRRWWIPVLVVLFASILIFADQRGWLMAPAHSDFERYHGVSARVMRVVDGDTIDVAIPDLQRGTPLTRVRLLGIDAPEVGRSGSKSQPYADAARRFVESVANGRIVRLHLESARVRGQYERILAHVELPDGIFLNRALLLEGLAQADDRLPHARLRWYEQAERRARQQQIGMWAARTSDE